MAGMFAQPEAPNAVNVD